MTTTRRTPYRAVAVILAALFLTQGSTCSVPATTTQAITQYANDANLIAGGMQAVVSSLQGLTNASGAPVVSQADLVTMQGYLATLQTDAKALAAATATPPTSTLNEFVSIAAKLAPIALSFIPGGSALSGIITAAEALLPAVQAVTSLAAAATPNDAVTYAAARLTLAKVGAR